MTIAHEAPQPRQQRERQAPRIARRVRGLVAEQQLTGTYLARELGLDQRAFSRRYRGEVDWSVDELFELAPILGTSFEALCASRDLNPEPAD